MSLAEVLARRGRRIERRGDGSTYLVEPHVGETVIVSAVVGPRGDAIRLAKPQRGVVAKCGTVGSTWVDLCERADLGDRSSLDAHPFEGLRANWVMAAIDGLQEGT